MNTRLSQKKHAQLVINCLEELLAGLQLYYHNIRHFHWNVTGPHFIDLHAHFEEIYKNTEEFIDETAERMRALGTFLNKGIHDYVSLSKVDEQIGIKDPHKMLEAALKGSETLEASIDAVVRAAESNEDYGTTDIFSTRLAQTEKQSWMLRSLLEEQK